MKPLLLCFLPACVLGITPQTAHPAPLAALQDTLVIVVAQDGSGDTTTVQGGLALAHSFPAIIRVMPGYYDEMVDLGGPPLPISGQFDAAEQAASDFGTCQRL